MASTRIDLLSHNFSRSLRGYSPREVDSFIQDMADAMASLGEEKVAMSNKIASLEVRLAEHEEREHSLRETLVATQRMMEDLKNSAQREAQLILEAARGKAENLTNQGNLRLARIMDEIAEAQRIKAQFEYHLRSIIEGHLKLLQFGQKEENQLLSRAAAIGGNMPQTEGEKNGLKND